MSALLQICRTRTAVAVLGSGVVISLTALTGGIAPALAAPHTDPVTPTTTSVEAPALEGAQAPEETEAREETQAPKVTEVPEETVAPEVTQEERVCRLAQSRDLFLARAVDRYRLLDPNQKHIGVAAGTLDEIEVQLQPGLTGEPANP